jgi:uncharacterized protein YjbI with pentapeptide repeats
MIHLQGADLRGAELRGADLRFANLRDARTTNAKLGALPGTSLRTLLQAPE